MFKALTPIFALLIAIGLGYTYVRPEFLEIQKLQNEARAYDEAYIKAEEIVSELNQKKAEKDSLSTIALERLAVMVPEEVHEVAAIVDIDALARKHHMVLSEIGMKAVTAPAADGETLVAVPSGSPTESVDITFSLTGSYEDFRDFTTSLEKSLVFFDVTGLEFKESPGDLFKFTMTIRTYAFQLKS